MKKVLLTGATGLIGKEAIKPLKEAGFEVFAPSLDEFNLFDDESLKKAFEKIKPTHLLHFAWATTDDYLTSNINFDFLIASVKMLKYFNEFGGKRAVYAGTCFEYEFTDEPLKEHGQLNPTTTYAKCKNYLREISEIYCTQNNISFGWGRIFYVYGHGEHQKRLTSHIINNLKNDKEVIIQNGELIKDYVYTKDIAGAFAKFLDTNIEGCINISTGTGIALKDYAGAIAKRLGKEKFLIIKNEPINQPSKIIGDNSRLINEVGYKIKYTLENAIEEIINGD